MTLTRHENGAGATPTCGRRRRRADQLRSAASAKCRRRRRTALIQIPTCQYKENGIKLMYVRRVKILCILSYAYLSNFYVRV